ncbi:restriction endonuclease subunit S [Limosilactobacillus agrestis]|nr:restriction endonuclease subunit S [Limosilactobacillus agrestis]MCD7120220.1 restriction endonuclease subunit S [Limosilactobacillus agrestis]
MGETLTGFEYGLNTPATDYDGINKYLRITDIDDVSHKFDISHLTSPKLKDDNYLLANGDILFARTGASVGKSYRYSNIDGKVYYAGFLIKAHIKDYFSTNFIFDTTLLPRYHYFVQVTSMRSGQPGINAKEYQKYIIYTPSENEQNKISDLILTIQKLIDLQQRKLKQLKRLKTAMLQQLFVEKNSKLPILRFKNFNGNWEKRKFSELATIRRGLTYKPKDVRDSGKNSKRVLRSSNINENSFVIYNDDVFVDKSSINIAYVHNNDILITAANGSSKLVGKHALIHDIPDNSAVHGGFMLLASSNNPEFINALMSSPWYSRFVNNYVIGGNGAIGNLKKDDLDSQIIYTPAKNEIKKIGHFFNRLDNFITHQQNKLTQLTTLKKYLLQKLFI